MCWPCHASRLTPNRLMLAVVSSPHGFETILTDVATLFQAHLVQPGRALGGRTPGKILLSRVLTATLATSCRTPLIYPKNPHRCGGRASDRAHTTQQGRSRNVHPKRGRQALAHLCPGGAT